jgi:UDP:flavonoid glycosyltransferase YjiC (YdhE family)
MRILFAFAGGAGHAGPLVPIAEAARAAGHAVAFAGRASALRGAFELFPDPDDPPPPAAIASLLELDPEREDRALRDGFAGRIARHRAAQILEIVGRWTPDVVVCDEIDWGAMVAAERAGVPHATVLVTAAGSFVRPQVVGETVDAVRAEHGLTPDPGFGMPARHLVLSPCPPSFRDPAFPLPPTGRAVRPPLCDRPRRTSEPTVYFTLGTVFNVESGDLFDRVLAGLHDLPVIATVGRQIDPRRFGRQPPNLRIERELAHADVLPDCDLVVSHGGSGTVVAALAAGLPCVLLPMGGDQAHNAARCEVLGVGVTLDPLRATPDEIREAVGAVLGDRGYRKRAERLRAEALALPGPEECVRLIAAVSA